MPKLRNSIYCTASLLALVACGQSEPTNTAPAQTNEAEQTEQAPQPDSASAVLELAGQHAAQVLQISPEFATSLGVSEEIGGNDYNSRLGQYGFEASQIARQLNEQFLQDIRTIDRSTLSGQAAITYDVLRDAYQTGARRNQFEFGGATPWGSGSPYIVTQLTGPHLFLPRLLQTQQPLSSKEDAEAYLARLSEFGRAFDEVGESIGADAAFGVVPPLSLIHI